MKNDRNGICIGKYNTVLFLKCLYKMDLKIITVTTYCGFSKYIESKVKVMKA